MNTIFPEMINSTKKLNIPIEGLSIHVLQADNHEIWFLHTKVDIDYPTHAHAEQWSIVLEGRIELTIKDKCEVYTKGDRYIIPEGMEHSVKMYAGYSEVMFIKDLLSNQY